MKKLFVTIALLTTTVPSQVLAFSTNYHHWDYGNPTQVAVTIQSSVPGSWITPIARGMSAWNNAGARFRFVAGYADHNVAYKNLWMYPSALAVTYIREWWGTRITDRDTDFSTRYPWSSDGSNPSAYDVQSIMAHELGHWLQLNDLYNASDYWKTMYGYGTRGATYQRTLEQDDINGIKSLYGW